MKKRNPMKGKRVAALLLMLSLLAASCLPASAATSALREVYDPITGVSRSQYADDGHYTVGTAEELAALKLPAGRVSYVELTADIDMSGVAFTPLLSDLTAPDAKDYTDELAAPIFLEGNGHTIANLSVTTAGAHVGLFAYLYHGSVVQNVNFRNVDMITDGSPYSAGAVAGLAVGRVTLHRVTVDATSSVESRDGFAGGLVGMILDETGRKSDACGTEISYCINEGAVRGHGRVGGLVGSYQSMDPIAFTYCINRGAVSNVSGDPATPGGILGIGLTCLANKVAEDYAGKAYVFADCVNEGTLTVEAESGPAFTGGMVGDLDDKDSTLSMTRCYDLSDRVSVGAGKITHGALLGKERTVELTFASCLSVGDKYRQLIGNNELYEDDSAPVSSADEAVTKADAAASDIAEQIASIGELAVPRAEISAESRALSLRMRLDEPYGVMAITSLLLNKTPLSVEDYASYADGYGFLFLASEKIVTEAELITRGERVAGAKYETDTYRDGKRFCAAYEGVDFSSLDGDIYFAAYTELGGRLFLSEIRRIRLLPTMMTLASEGEQTPEAEKKIYRTLSARYVSKHGPVSTGQRVLAATYNIYHCADMTKIDLSKADWGYWAFTDTIVNSDNIAKVLYDNNIEICGFNETTAYAKTYGDGDTVQAERIAKRLTELTDQTYYWGFAPAKIGGYANRGDPNGAFGNAFVSKYPILDMACYGIGSPQYDRCLYVAKLDVNGTELSLVGTHFDNTNANERKLAVEAVREVLGMIQTPVVVMGDLNATPDGTDGVYDAMLEMLEPTAPKHQLPASHPTEAPSLAIDYIMHSDDITSTNLHVDTTPPYSDHLPVIVTLHIPRK